MVVAARAPQIADEFRAGGRGEGGREATAPAVLRVRLSYPVHDKRTLSTVAVGTPSAFTVVWSS